MMPPLVSVLIPCHNAAPWIADAIASARAQVSPTFRLEIIVVDDGSTDESVSATEHVRGPDLLLVRQANAGAAAARQRALDSAQGDFIQYLDADDLLGAGKIAPQLQRLLSAPEAVASARWERFSCNVPATAATTSTPSQPNWRDLDPIEYLTITFRNGAMMHPAAWLTPRSIIERAGPWDPALTLDDDGEYFTRIVLAARSIIYCSEALSLYRSGLGGSLSASRSAASWQSALVVCQRCTDALIARSDTTEARNACALYFLRLAFAAYPDAPAVSTTALCRARALDSRARIPAAGPMFQSAAAVLGWRAARRLQRWWERRPARPAVK